MTVELQAFARQLATLTLPEQLFGLVTGPRELQRLYHQFARIAHADRYQTPDDKALAHEAFTRLTALYDEAKQRLSAGLYGTNRPTTPTTIRHRRTSYTLTATELAGDLSMLYLAEATGDRTGRVWLKVARTPTENDWLRQEASALTTLGKASGNLSLHHYLPTLWDTFQIANRQTNVLSTTPGYIPILKLLRKYPEGIDPRHFVWIWKRLLTVLGFAHAQEIIHGAVLPTHLLVNPSNHGLMLIDWCWSVPRGGTIKAIAESARDLYAPAVLAKAPVGRATDIYMGALTMMLLLGGVSSQLSPPLPASVPPPFRRFLMACTLPARQRRPADAWALLDEFKDVAQAVYGPPRFVRLEV